jgi:hypothetical protein
VFRTALILTTALFATGIHGQDLNATPRTVFQIDAQDLASALQTFGRLRELRMVFVSEDIVNLKTSGLHAGLTDKEALQELLRGTGLTFEFLDARTVSIIPQGPATRSVAPSTAAAPLQRKSNQRDEDAPLTELTVTAGKILSEAALKAAIHSFALSRGTPDAANAHLARWYEPICPQTSGLSPGLNAYISARIQQVARTVGTPVGAAKDCKAPNIEIMFTSEPQKLLDDVAARYQGVLGFPFQAKVKRVATVARPIQSWYATATRAPSGGGSVTFSRDWRIDYASEPDPTVKIGTRLPVTVIAALVNVLVVADAPKVKDRRPDTLADYIAVLALSQYRPTQHCNELSSILYAMSSSCSPPQGTEVLSRADAAYLRGLYSADLSQPLQTEIGDIADRMFQELRSEQD